MASRVLSRNSMGGIVNSCCNTQNFPGTYIEGIPIHKQQTHKQYEHLPPAVLVECGSFSPVTTFHLQMLETHRDYLMNQTSKYHILGGLLSPVHDAYGKKSQIMQEHRIELCRLACQGIDWVDVSDFEVSQPGWSRTRLVLDHISTVLRSLVPELRVLLVMGADVLESFLVPGLWQEEDILRILSVHGIVVLERDGVDLNQIIQTSFLKQFESHITIVPQELKNNVSSTLVRKRLQQGLSIKWLMPDPCIDYIYEHKLYHSVKPETSQPLRKL